MQEIHNLLNNEHLNRFAGLFAIAMAPGWRMRHPEIASVRGRLDRIARLIRGGETFDVSAFSMEWVHLITDITHADADLTYSSADLDWLYGLLTDQSHARMVIMLLLAVASAKPRWYTCEQVAQIPRIDGKPGKSAIWWRKQAALESNPWLAQISGRTYLFNELILRAHGVEVPQSLQVEEESAENE